MPLVVCGLSIISSAFSLQAEYRLSTSFIRKFKDTPGAISVCECIAIINLAQHAPEGIYMDIGSHAGKSSMSAAQGLKNGTFYLVDPCYDLHNKEAWENTVQGSSNKMPWAYVGESTFCQNIIDNVARNGILPVLLGDYSLHAIPKYSDYSWVFVDSDTHQGGLLGKEVRLLEDRMIQGGIIAFHDYNSQFKEVKEAHEYLLSTGKYENVEIDWPSIVKYVQGKNLEAGNNSWHHTEMDAPCFVGAVKRK